MKKDQPVTAAIDLRDDSQTGPDELTVGTVRLVVHVSGDARSLRVRDPNGPLAKGFLGFTWFPIDLKYRVVGRFIKDAEPRKISVLNTYGDVDQFTTEGVVEFTLLGQTLRLRPFTTRPKRFYFVFKDASSGHETYEAARFLYADLARRRHGGPRLQPGLQPAVLVQPVHDVPDPAAREQPADQDPRRREGLPGARAAAGREDGRLGHGHCARPGCK